MADFKYVLLASDGTSYDVSRHGFFHDRCKDLGPLLDGGWRPVHETPLGAGPQLDEDAEGTGQACFVLISLVKDSPERS
jgi:hypothetical protein